jgi:hypothetical protein
VRWYTPKVIATEESRTNTEYGTLTTADEIKSVEIGENGLIEVGYIAEWKESVSEKARASIFVGSNQLKIGISSGGALAFDIAKMQSEKEGTPNTFSLLHSDTLGLDSAEPSSGAYAGHATTGQVLGSSFAGGCCKIFGLAAGSYNLSIKYKAESGTVTAKNRKLWVVSYG